MNTFKINRFINLLLYRVGLHKSRWLMQLGGLTGVALLITGIFIKDVAKYNAFSDFYEVMFDMSVVFIGAYISSRAFIEYKSTANGFLYMMLPASSFEKFIITLLFSGVVFFGFYALIYIALANISTFIWSNVYHFPMQFFNLFSDKMIDNTIFVFKIFLIFQPVFLLGSLIFRKNHFIATAITIFIILLVITLIGFLSVKIAYGESPDFHLDINDVNIYLAIVFHLLINTAVFFKLKEKQI
jgi:hypothetical protein